MNVTSSRKPSPQATVLIVGGYGTVGSALSELIAARYPQIKLLIGGRRLRQATAAAARLPYAEGVQIDVTRDDPLASLSPAPHSIDAIIVSVNDSRDRLLSAALRRNIPLVDLTRWTQRIEDAKRIAAQHSLSAPIVLASGWMASAPSIVAATQLRGKAPARQIDVDILFSLKDRSGADSVTHFADAHQSFRIWEHGSPRTVAGFSAPKKVTFSGNRTFRCRRLSTPEQETLVLRKFAEGVSIRLAFDHQATNTLFAASIRSGIWGTLSRTRRMSLLHRTSNTPGSSAAHEVILSIHSQNGLQRVAMIDALGQAHFTAASALSQLERLLGLGGRKVPPPGVSFPEDAHDPAADIRSMQQSGIQFEGL